MRTFVLPAVAAAAIAFAAPNPAKAQVIYGGYPSYGYGSGYGLSVGNGGLLQLGLNYAAGGYGGGFAPSYYGGGFAPSYYGGGYGYRSFGYPSYYGGYRGYSNYSGYRGNGYRYGSNGYRRR